MTDRLDVLAWNALAAALIRDLDAVPPEQRNLVWRHFCGADTRRRFTPDDWDRTARNHVAHLRAEAARDPDDRALADLVGRLRAASPDFADLWNRHDVRIEPALTKRLDHPVVGPIELECETVLLPEHGQRLVIHRPRPGSPSAAAFDRLRTAAAVQAAEAAAR